MNDDSLTNIQEQEQLDDNNDQQVLVSQLQDVKEIRRDNRGWYTARKDAGNDRKAMFFLSGLSAHFPFDHIKHDRETKQGVSIFAHNFPRWDLDVNFCPKAGFAVL